MNSRSGQRNLTFGENSQNLRIFGRFSPLTFRIITRLSSKSYSMIALFFQTLIFPRKLHTLTIGKIRINWFSPSSTFGDNSRNPWIFWSFFPLTFRIIARFFSYLFFHRKTSYFNDWQNQNKLTLHQFHVWGKITKSLDFWEFFPQIFRIIARFFANFYFHKKTLYLNDWQNRNKLIFPHFHFWGKLTKSSDFWEFFPPNFQNNYTFFCKLLFSHESSILYILAKSE